MSTDKYVDFISSQVKRERTMGFRAFGNVTEQAESLNEEHMKEEAETKVKRGKDAHWTLMGTRVKGDENGPHRDQDTAKDHADAAEWHETKYKYFHHKNPASRTYSMAHRKEKYDHHREAARHHRSLSGGVKGNQEREGVNVGHKALGMITKSFAKDK